jgi:hypothetical protein
MKDPESLFQFSNLLSSRNISTYIAELSLEPGVSLSKKISDSIRNSDIVLAVLSKKGTRSEWVNQEIGMANALGKIIIPVVENGAVVKGILADLDSIFFDPKDIHSILPSVAAYVEKLKLSKDQRVSIGAVLSFLLGIWVLSNLE